MNKISSIFLSGWLIMILAYTLPHVRAEPKVAHEYFFSSDVCCKCVAVYDRDAKRIFLKPVEYYWGQGLVDKSALAYPLNNMWMDIYKEGSHYICVHHINTGGQISREIVNDKFKIELAVFGKRGPTRWVSLKFLYKIKAKKMPPPEQQKREGAEDDPSVNNES